jgi:predicted nucleic acid-binding protein
VDRKFLDVNALAVYLDSSHPGHPYVEPVVRRGLEGAYQMVLAASVLLRARWVLTSRWGGSAEEVDRSLRALASLRSPAYADGAGPTILRAMDLAQEHSQDVYDCYLVALAEGAEATHLVTTDSGLRRVCESTEVRYENPVPPRVLSQFGATGRGN